MAENRHNVVAKANDEAKAKALKNLEINY